VGKRKEALMGGLYMIPLDLGDVTINRCQAYMLKFVGEKERSKRIAVYIGGAKKKILVDAGAPDIERVLKYHTHSWSEPYKPEQKMEYQLAKAGVKAEEIEVVVLTHLHYDHVGYVDRFPNAKFIVSEVEFKYALDPLPPYYLAYESFHVGLEPLFLKVIKQIKTIDMQEKKIVEGVRIIPLPGHTPGSIGLVVETEKGPHVIAGDAVPKYGNLKGFPNENLPHYPSGFYTDLQAMWKSMELVHDIVEGDYSKVIAGHDPLVFQKEKYP
jgi:N-acyl homoserine lactone hydrolase